MSILTLLILLAAAATVVSLVSGISAMAQTSTRFTLTTPSSARRSFT